jgi:hypothetical protein
MSEEKPGNYARCSEVGHVGNISGHMCGMDGGMRTSIKKPVGE